MINELLTVIVDFGKGTDILSTAKKNGITGGTIFLGKGTIKKPLLEKLSLSEIRKEIVVMLGTESGVESTMRAINKSYRLEKKGTGVCYTTAVNSYRGIHHPLESKTPDVVPESEDKNMYDLVTVIVDRGMGEKVIELSNSIGARGGTIIHGRGSGIHETQTVFSIVIEPEKDIVIIALNRNLTNDLTSIIGERFNLSKAGTGILYVQEIKSAIGIK